MFWNLLTAVPLMLALSGALLSPNMWCRALFIAGIVIMLDLRYKRARPHDGGE